MDRGYNGKRPHPLYEGDLADRNGRHQKRRNQGGNYSSRELGGGHFVPRDIQMPPIMTTGSPLPDDMVFRILCPAPKIGSVIGKGGSIIKTLRQDSGAKIKIADAIPGVDERVIVISSLDRGGGGDRGRSSRDSRERGGRDGRSRERDGGKEGDRKERDSSHRESEKLTPAQEALFKVHARIIADVEAPGGDGSDREEEPSQQVVTRLLVPNNQIGCLLGKGGKIIEQMRQSTGAQIRVLPKDQLPGCALPSDEIVQVSGEVSVLHKALLAISSRLQENPPRERPPPSFASPGPTFVPVNDYLPVKESYAHRSKGDAHLFMPEPHMERDAWGMRGGNLPLERPEPRRGKEGRDSGENELVFRLLCPSDKIGSVIGKGGSIIYSLRKETGARIKIANAVPGSDERVIIVSAFELPGDSFSPALEAMIQVQGRITAEMGGDKDGIVTTRLLVPTNQIGCLLGKGGSIIEDMRRATRANLRVLPKDTLPRCAMEADELVQIVGDTTVAREALFQVISRLRNNAFRESGGDTGRGGGGGGHRGDYGHPMPPLSLPRETYTSSYDFGGRMGSRSPRGGVYSLPSLHSSPGYGRLGSPPPDAWGMGGGGGLSSLAGFGGGPSHLIQPLAGGYGGGGSHRVIGSHHGHGTAPGTMSTIEVHIPNSAVGSVIGKGGSNIAHIRQISGAKVKLHNSEQGAKDRVLELSGTQEQTHAAQSLVQAYMQSSLGGGILSSSGFAA